jgi:hypothetical protein
LYLAAVVGFDTKVLDPLPPKPQYILLPMTAVSPSTTTQYEVFAERLMFSPLNVAGVIVPGGEEEIVEMSRVPAVTIFVPTELELSE